MDKFGWVMIAQLIGVLDIKIEDLEQIVKDNKQRFSLTVLRQKLEQVKVILLMLMYNLSKLNHQVFCFMEQPLGF
jgi:hypothetical protein